MVMFVVLLKYGICSVAKACVALLTDSYRCSSAGDDFMCSIAGGGLMGSTVDGWLQV